VSTEERQRLGVLIAEAERMGLALDDRAMGRFARYLDLLAAWSDRGGLTAITEPAAIQRRHFAESLALLAALREAGAVPPGAPIEVADLGSGAGFPGVPLHIAQLGADPPLRLTLIESNGRRCDFLRELVEVLALPDVTVVQARAEEAGRDPALREHFGVVVARALAALPVLLEYALPLLRDGGLLAAPKGSRATEELAAAEAALTALGGNVESSLPLRLPAAAPPQTVVLVRRRGPLPDRYPRRPGIPDKRPL